MEVLIKQDQVAPVRIGLEFFAVSVHWTATGGISEKQLDEPVGEVGRHLPEIGRVAGPRRKGKLEIVTQEIMMLLQRLDDEVVQGKPHRAAPIRIPAEYSGRRLPGFVIQDKPLPVEVQDEGFFGMALR